MINFVKRAICLIIGSIVLLVGIFTGVAGVVSGFGNHNLVVRLGYVFVGLLTTAAGIYLYYLGSNKSLSKLLDDFIRAIINSL
jgi:hypothetical protein